MKRSKINIAACILMILSTFFMSNIIPTCADSAESSLYFNDTCENLSLVNYATDSIIIDSSKYSAFRDSACITSTTGAENGQYIVYKTDKAIDSLEVTAFVQNTIKPDGSVEFYVSEDGSEYVPLYIEVNKHDYDSSADISNIIFRKIANYSAWSKVLYNVYGFDGDYRYLKIVFPKATTESQIADVVIGLRDDDTRNILSYDRLLGNESGIPYDVKETKYEQAHGLLKSLGIKGFENEMRYGTHELLKREDFAYMLSELLKFNPDANDSYPGIIALAKRGLISGDGDNQYRPEDNISYIEAVKMILSALGYDDIAQFKGGFPVGYYSIAQSEGLLKNIEFVNNYELKRGDAALLLSNMLLMPQISNTYISGGNLHKAQDEEPVLWTLYKTAKSEGVVFANGKTSLIGSDVTLGPNSVMINDRVYNTGSFEQIHNYLAFNVIFYYNEDNEIIYACKDDNIELLVGSDEIIDETTATKFVYYEGDSREFAYISETCDMIYNNAWCSFDVNKLKNNNGYVKLVDNDEDETVDVAFVYNFTSNVVTALHPTTMTVQCEYPDNKKFDFSEAANVYFYKDGRRAAFDDIKVGNVLSVAVSGTGSKKSYYVIIAYKRVTGDVNVIQTVGDSFKIGIGQAEYEISPECKKAVNNGYLFELKVGNKADFYLDAFGKVAYYSNLSYKSYAYVRRVTKNEMGDEMDVTLRMFFPDGKWRSVDVCDDVKHNNKKIKKEELYKVLNEKGTFTDLVRYKLNSEGKLTAIETVEKENNFYTNKNEEKRAAATESDTFRICNQGTNDGYRPETNGIAQSFMTHDTIIFKTPDAGRKDQEELYKIMTMSELYNSFVYQFVSYDETDFGVAAAMVFTNNDRSYMTYKNAFVVEKVREVVDGLGDLRFTIIGYRGQEDVNTTLSLEPAFADAEVIGINALAKEENYTPFAQSSINPGDYVYTISDGKDVVKWYSAKTFLANPEKDFSYARDSYSIRTATVVAVGPNNLFKISQNGTISRISLKSVTRGVNLVEVSRDGKVRVHKATLADIQAGDKIVMELYSSLSDYVCIYRLV